MIQKTKIERSKPCHEKIGKDFPLLVLGTDDVPFLGSSRICGEHMRSLLSANYFGRLYLVRSSFGHITPKNQGDLMECSKCGKQEPRNAWHSETEEHTGRTTYTSNHSGSNPTKHTYTKLTNCRHCNYLMDRDFGFTGCTAAGCREAQGLKPMPMDA